MKEEKSMKTTTTIKTEYTYGYKRSGGKGWVSHHWKYSSYEAAKESLDRKFENGGNPDIPPREAYKIIKRIVVTTFEEWEEAGEEEIE